ncbi:hypothetical protein JAAARDRAFT_590772 [Jaapia argillacea MUCL 33604]|uniref:Uncharacterized protein n=1 Tax=Jaapia argillacea MUCL 33604 TaxID=933084 RepID=A0A067PI42_9AGAM|nr:hypothetical protein JAAARDRAFT_590772 [Jaapia argillacea MUCL 33604]
MLYYFDRSSRKCLMKCNPLEVHRGFILGLTFFVLSSLCRRAASFCLRWTRGLALYCHFIMGLCRMSMSFWVRLGLRTLLPWQCDMEGRLRTLAYSLVSSEGCRGPKSRKSKSRVARCGLGLLGTDICVLRWPSLVHALSWGWISG